MPVVTGDWMRVLIDFVAGDIGTLSTDEVRQSAARLDTIVAAPVRLQDTRGVMPFPVGKRFSTYRRARLRKVQAVVRSVRAGGVRRQAG